MTAAEVSALPQPTRINRGDVAPQPHSPMLIDFDSNRACAEPLSRSFVLAALRALHLDTGVGFSATHIEVETAQNVLDNAPPLQG